MIQFSVADLHTPEGIERVFLQVNAALEKKAAPGKFPEVDLNKLATLLAPQIRDQLQVGGTFPINLQSLLPSASNSTAQFIQDTHANRLALYPAVNYPIGTVFYEVDRTSYYMVFSGGGVTTWQCIPGGYMKGTLTPDQKPTDLTGNDVRFEFFSLDFSKFFRWTGTAWERRGDQLPAGFIGTFKVGPAIGIPGWQLCDGSTVTASRDDATTESIVVPDFSSSPYLKVSTTTALGPNAASGLTDEEVDSVEVQSGTGTFVSAFPHTHGPGDLELPNTQLRAYYRL